MLEGEAARLPVDNSSLNSDVARLTEDNSSLTIQERRDSKPEHNSIDTTVGTK